MSEIAFDHSALTEIYELPNEDRDAVITGLRAMGRIRITSANALEAAGHGNKEAREKKLAFYKELTGAIEPLDPPNELLRKTAVAHHEKKTKITLGSDELWTLLQQPEFAEHVYDESFAWNKERKQTFKQWHQELRDIYQEHFEKIPTDRATSAGALIEYFCERIETYLDIIIIPFYKEASGHTITKDDARTFTQKNNPWRLFWAGRIYALYTRAVQAQGSSDKKNAGQTDLESSIYLAFTDIFITADKAQYDALIGINKLNPRKTRVLWWPDLKAGFLLPTR
jgi:hypothetical protein